MPLVINFIEQASFQRHHLQDDSIILHIKMRLRLRKTKLYFALQTFLDPLIPIFAQGYTHTHLRGNWSSHRTRKRFLENV